MKKIAVLVSGGGTNLQALIDAQGRGEIVNGTITAVISNNPEAYALERAKKAGIPSYVLTREEYPTARELTVALVEKLQQLDIQLVVMAGFMTIVTGSCSSATPTRSSTSTPPSSPPSAERAASASMSMRRPWPTG